jgi:hypothetical protein
MFQDPLYQLQHHYPGCWASSRTLDTSGCVNDGHSVYNCRATFNKAGYTFILELKELEKIFINYPRVRERQIVAQRFDTWTTKFQTFLETNRERFNGSKAPVVVMGCSDAIGRRTPCYEVYP